MSSKSLGGLRKLVLVRHGTYDKTGGLDLFGEGQMKVIAEKLRLIVDGQSFLILSSTAKRTTESAEIITTILKKDFEEHKVLWSEGKKSSHPEDIPAVLALLKEREKDADIIILVTHLEYVEGLPWDFGKSFLGIGLHKLLVKRGEGIVINCETKNLRRL